MNELPVWTPKPGDVFEFKGQYRFLSNFWPSRMLGQTLEHHYQAAKFLSGEAIGKVIESKTAGEAKRRGRMFELRPDWDRIKDVVMLNLVRTKFQDPQLTRQLIKITGQLVEGNHWRDQYWGATKNYSDGNWTGHNKLGVILMQVRREIQQDILETDYKR